jgi:hypothetical protein
MSRLADVERFTASAFPSVEILSMLVSGDFIDRLREGHFDLPVTEVLAKACHEAWKKKREEDGWTYGEVRDDANKKNPRLVQYDKLSLEWKEDNRKTARLTYGKLRDVGLKIVPDTILGSGRSRSKVITSKVQKRLMEIEHEIWLRDHFIRGYQWDKKTIEPLRLHRDMAEFKDVPRTDRELDRAISETIEGTLRSNGYALVEIAAPGPETPTGTKGTERGRQRKRSPGRAPAKKSAKRKKK